MCYKIHKVIFHKLLVYVKICSLPIGLRQAIMEHAGESGVQLSVCVEMEAYSDPVAAASNPFFCKYKEESRRRPCVANIESHNWQDATSLSAATFQDWIKQYV